MNTIRPDAKLAKRAIAALKLADAGWRVRTCCPTYEHECREVVNGDDMFTLVNSAGGWSVEE